MNTMCRVISCSLLVAAVLLIPQTVQAESDWHEWTDVSGTYRWEGRLFAVSQDLVVIQDRRGRLQAVETEQLNPKDREYAAQQWNDTAADRDSETQMWTMKSGLKVPGVVEAYRSGTVEVDNHNGTVRVNRRSFRELDPVYQAMLARLIGETKDKSVQTVDDFRSWARRLRREKATLQVDGVVMRLADGESYAVPFELFADEDRKFLEAGWEQWSSAEATREQKSREDALLRAEAQQQRQREEAEKQRREQIELMQLGLLAVDVGLTSLWEVRLAPGKGNSGRPRTVIVPAGNSQQARQVAMQKNPGYVAGPVVEVSNRGLR